MRIHICKFSHNIEKCTLTHTHNRETQTHRQSNTYTGQNWQNICMLRCWFCPQKPYLLCKWWQARAGRERELRRWGGGSDEEAQSSVALQLCANTEQTPQAAVVRCVNTASILAKNSPRFALLLHCTNPTGNASLFAFSIVLSLSLLPCFVLSSTQFVCMIEV